MYHIKHFKKPFASNVLTNFKNKTPKKYKISSLMGSIYRVNGTASNKKELEKGFDDFKINFVNNGYPKNLLNPLTPFDYLKAKKFSGAKTAQK